jgi:hypothetical protein
MSAFGRKADMTLASQSVGLPKPKLDLFQFESLANAYLGSGHHYCGRLVFSSSSLAIGVDADQSKNLNISRY